MYFDDEMFFTTEDMETKRIGIMEALEDKLVSMNMTSEQIEEVMEDVIIPYKIMYANEIERLEDEIEDLQMEYINLEEEYTNLEEEYTDLEEELANYK